jgi:RNA polymerase sigma factor (sigma-70 family)
MKRGHSKESQWIDAVRAGGKRRDRALKQLFQHSEYRALVGQVVEAGGGAKEDSMAVFRECLVRLDRIIRLQPGYRLDSFDTFLREQAQDYWGSLLEENLSHRRRVLGFVASDATLRQKLHATISKDGGTTETAEDCYQEGFLVLERQLAEGKYRGGALKGFFYQICYNLWRNRRKKKKELSVEESDIPPPVEKNTPQVLLEIEEVNERWRRAFESLDERCQKILTLKFFRRQSLSMAEIARRMNLKNAQNASNALSRCRQRWKERAEASSE